MRVILVKVASVRRTHLGTIARAISGMGGSRRQAIHAVEC